MTTPTDILSTVLLSTLAEFSPEMRLIFYEIIDAEAMIIKPVIKIRSDTDGILWIDDQENEPRIFWVDRYPESFIKTIQYDILLPGELEMFSQEDQEKLVNQEIRGILTKSVFVTRSNMNKDDFYGVIVVESMNENVWKQNDFINIIQASEKIALGILCNDVLTYVSDRTMRDIPASISQMLACTVVIDDRGTVLYAPYAIVEILGYRAYGEMLSRNIGKFVHPDDIMIIQDFMEYREHGGIKIFSRDIRYVTRTKGMCLCETRIISGANNTTILKIAPPQWYEYDKDKNRTGVVYGFDFVKYFAEQIDGIVWVVNDKLEFTYLSSQVTHLLGWSVDQVIHDSRVRLFDQDTLEEFADVLIQGALAYRENPNQKWTQEIRGNALTCTGARVPVVIRSTINTLGGDYLGFGGVIKPV